MRTTNALPCHAAFALLVFIAVDWHPADAESWEWFSG
jgi:hypothetical protein